MLYFRTVAPVLPRCLTGTHSHADEHPGWTWRSENVNKTLLLNIKVCLHYPIIHLKVSSTGVFELNTKQPAHTVAQAVRQFTHQTASLGNGMWTFVSDTTDGISSVVTLGFFPHHRPVLTQSFFTNIICLPFLLPSQLCLNISLGI